MAASDELRTILHASSDWSQSLRRFAEQLTSRPASEHISEPALVLAQAFEAIEPDRSHAVRMHLLAWRTRPVLRGVLTRARELCREVGNLQMAATIAGLQYDQQQDPRLAYAEGIAWLDANDPDRAVEPLTKASRTITDDESLRIALATAKREWGDADSVVTGLIRDAQATTDTEAAAARFLCAARIERICGSEGDRYGNLLRHAFRSDPRNSSTYGMLEDWLLARGDRDGLLEVYRFRARLAQSAVELVEEYRRAGTKLVLQQYLKGLGLRLLERSLDYAYESELTEIPGLIASLSLIRQYSEQAESQVKVLGLLANGLGRSLPKRDLLWMAMTGLDIAWRGLGDEETGRAYASIVAEHAPAHPLLQELCATTNLASEAAEEEQPATDDQVFLDQWVADAPAVIDGQWLPKKIGLDAALQNQKQPEPVVPAPVVAEQPIVVEQPEPIVVEQPEPIVVEQPEPIVVEQPVVMEQPEPIVVEQPAAELQFLTLIDPEPASQPKPVMSLIPSSALAALKQYRHEPLVPTADLAQAPVRKRARRILVPADVRVTSGDAENRVELSAITRDLSATGLFLVTDTSVPLGTVLHISLQLPGEDEWALQDVELTGRVVRQVDNGLGVDFVSPPADTVERITDLINTDDD